MSASCWKWLLFIAPAPPPRISDHSTLDEPIPLGQLASGHAPSGGRDGDHGGGPPIGRAALGDLDVAGWWSDPVSRFLGLEQTKSHQAGQRRATRRSVPADRGLGPSG